MRLLLDTHVLLWVLADDPALSAEGRALIGRAETVYVSAVSVWEVSIKAALGKLRIDQDGFLEGLRESGFSPLAISWDHAAAVRQLPDYHRDPFDRLLIAQALAEPLRLLTHDHALARYSELVTLV